MDANTPSSRPAYLARYKDCHPGWSGFGWGVNSPPVVRFRKAETRRPWQGPVTQADMNHPHYLWERGWVPLDPDTPY